MTTLTIGVSSCLAGMRVRYDGRDKRDAFVADTLASAARLVLVCPEVELGLGTPRETLQLVRAGAVVRMISASDHDITGDMAAFARERVDRLADDDLDGYVLKSRSPSCGLGDAPVLDRQADVPPASADGLFAAALTRRWPHLPVTTERALAEPDARAHFLACATAYRELKAFFRGSWNAATLLEFHRSHRTSLLAQDAAEYRRIERLVHDAGVTTPVDLAALHDTYVAAFMIAIRHRPAAESPSRADSASAD